MELIDRRYSKLKYTCSIHSQVAQQESLSLTTDMWTYRTGAGYIHVHLYL